MDCVIGIDGGGTKTLCKIAALDGHVLGSELGGPCNINALPPAEIAGMLRTLLMRATEKAGVTLRDCRYLCIGTAGAGRSEEQKQLENMLRAAGYCGRLLVTDDAKTVLRVGVGREGMILIAGTGSICLGCTADGKAARAGGWGHIIGDEGSGYAAAVRVCKAVMQAYDGRGPKTALTGLLMQRLGLVEEEQLIPYIYRQGNGKKELASLSELLKPAMESGDAAAHSIILETADELLGHVRAVSARLDLGDCLLVTSGGFINNNLSLREAFLSLIKQRMPSVQVQKLKGDSADGAVLLAMDQLNA